MKRKPFLMRFINVKGKTIDGLEWACWDVKTIMEAEEQARRMLSVPEIERVVISEWCLRSRLHEWRTERRVITR